MPEVTGLCPHPFHGRRRVRAGGFDAEVGSEQRPVYRVQREAESPAGTRLCRVVVDEGWRTSVLCDGMYEWAAQWLVEVLQGRPFAPGRR